MALNVDKVFRFVQFVANKEHRGWISPDEFNIAAELAQIAVYSKLEAMYLATKKVHNDMRPFLRKTDNLAVASGVASYPNNFRQYVSGINAANDKSLSELTQAEFWDATNSSIILPTDDYPTVTLREDGIHVSPSTITDITIDYIAKIDTTPEWGYTGTTSPVYDSGASTDFLFDDNLFVEIATNILMNVGMNIKDENVTQYGMAFNSAK